MDTSLASLLGDESTTAVEEQMNAVIPHVYKHKKIASFATGEDRPERGQHRFEFRGHLLTITGRTQAEADAKNNEFLKLAKGFLKVDQLNIVKLKNVENEIQLSDVKAATTVRGVVGTNHVADKPVGDTAAAPAADSVQSDALANYAPAPQGGMNQPVNAPAKPGLSFLKQT